MIAVQPAHRLLVSRVIAYRTPNDHAITSEKSPKMARSLRRLMRWRSFFLASGQNGSFAGAIAAV